MSILTNLRRPSRQAANGTPRAEPEKPTPTAPPLMRFLTRGGAVVAVRAKDLTWVTYQGDNSEVHREAGHVWRCDGCGVNRECRHEYYYRDGRSGSSIDAARITANDHAAACRAMPAPEPT